MSTEKQTNESISSRLKALIDLHTGGNLKKFAELSGINPVTLLNYSKGRMPKADALANICEFFGVNINWLLTGKGRRHIQSNDSELQPLDPNPEIADLMEGARRVLTSGNHIAFQTLEQNIRYFDHAIKAERQLDEIKSDVEMMKEEIARMKRENASANTAKGEPSSEKKIA